MRIGKNTVDISISSLLPKYEYSVVLAYNEALTELENAQYIKRILEKLYAQLRAEKVFSAFLVSESACIGDNILRDAYGDALNRNY